VTATEVIAEDSSVEHTTFKTLFTNVNADTLSVPVQLSFAESKVIVEPNMPFGITTLN
jgi:hypothetical protein